MNDQIVVRNELGTSGEFLKMWRNGQLENVCRLIDERDAIVTSLAEIELTRKSCNSPSALTEFAVCCGQRRRDFARELRKKAANLEDRRARLNAKLRDINERLASAVPRLDFTIDSAPTGSLVPRVIRKQNEFVADRNNIIDDNATLPTEEICKLLDRHFSCKSEVYDQLPKSWARDFSVKTFRDAYRDPECRNRVHKLISVRRRRAAYHKI